MHLGHTISSKKAKQLADKGAILIDVRDPVSFRDGTIPGATNMSLRQLPVVAKHPKATPIVVIGKEEDPATINAAVNYLTNFGFGKVCVVTNVETTNK